MCKDLKIKEQTAKAGSADFEGCREDITPLDEGKELTSSLLYTPIKSFSWQIQDRNAQEILQSICLTFRTTILDVKPKITR